MRSSDLNYARAVGLVRVFEADLIGKSGFSKLENCKSVNQFFGELGEFGLEFSSVEGFADFERQLDEKFLNVVEDIKKACPSNAPFSVLFSQNDCFNLQAVLMASFHGFDWRRLIKSPNFLSVDLISECVVAKNFDLLPVHFKSLAIWLFDGLEQGQSCFEIFKYYNKKVFETRLKMAEPFGCLFDLTRLEIDFENLRIVLRAIGLNSDETCLQDGLISGGFVDEGELFEAFCGGLSNLTSFFKLNLGLNLKDVLEFPGLVDGFFCEKINDFWFLNRSSPFDFAPIAFYLFDLKQEHRILKHIFTKIVHSNGQDCMKGVSTG